MTLTHEQISEGRQNAIEKLDEARSCFEAERDRLTNTIHKLDQWLWTNTEHKADDVVEEYVALRDQRAVIKKAYDTEDAYFKEQLETREVWLLGKMHEVGMEAMRTPHGTAYIQVKTRANCADWPLFWNYIATEGRFDLLEKRVAQGPISKMIADGEDLPPAISTFTEQTVTVRRS